MFWFLVLIGMCIPCWNAELTACSEDSQCPVDYYCEVDAYFCRQCLRCDDFKRAPPPGTTTCVKSVVECGGCLEQKSHSSNYECGPKPNLIIQQLGDTESKDIKLPVYAWVLLVLIAVVIVAGAALIPCINKATYTPVSISESQIARPGTNDHLEGTWSSPPAYNAVVNIPTHNIEESAPYIKPIVSAPPDDARECADHQATRPYSPPNYIRGPQLSVIPSPDRLSIHNDTEMENSVDGVISIRNALSDDDALPAGTVSNIAMEECPNGIRSSTRYQPVVTDISDTAENARSALPIVVVNNNVHLQAVSLTGAGIFVPQNSV